MLDLDFEIRDIVYGLNSLGLSTNFSCQGNHDGGRIGIAYISFSEGVKLPSVLIDYIHTQNWQIEREYTDPRNRRGVIYSIHSVDPDFPEDLVELEKRNSAFIDGWKDYLHRA